MCYTICNLSMPETKQNGLLTFYWLTIIIKGVCSIQTKTHKPGAVGWFTMDS